MHCNATSRTCAAEPPPNLPAPSVEAALAVLPYIRRYDFRWNEVDEHNFEPDFYTAHRDLYDTVRQTLSNM